ncbi:IS200/IS605 family accessory protein TnpB-related protein [Spirulina subsalsa]|uniref:IS200/IS605 family accessory protein TnpB-related protein n=1 Tax=Spirulina subsalsa TaxID=54311 RepID=UPI000526F8C2|nr:IS200/IS605 family accessory protein TnpB-related protein [Spirulina subsalsa]
MSKSIVRTDKWKLNPSPEVMKHLEGTVNEYRAYCKALSYVVMANWSVISTAKSQCSAVEKLIHRTSANPNPKHPYFGKRFYKFPSYLRRAAIEFVCGQVSSFLTRYQLWQSGIGRHKQAKPPKFNPEAGCYPALYRGQCIKFQEDFTVAEIKVWNGSDWVWASVQVVGLRQHHLLSYSKGLSPYLIVKQGKAHLSVPFKLHPQKLSGELVCAVDVGINTTATATIVNSGGTVISRKFFHRGGDIDRRDKVLQQIRNKAKQTKKLHKGFCKGLYRRAKGINHNMAQHISKEIVQFALQYGASVIVFEDLKAWKPKGGRKRSTLKQRFHGWLHRLLVQLTENKFVESGGKVELVYPRGTSSWAYDGSGKLQRSKKNYALATFQSGKRYNADLNGSCNIGARYWAYKLKLAYRNGRQLSSSKSSGDKQRMPVTLSALWDREAAHVRVRVSVT